MGIFSNLFKSSENLISEKQVNEITKGSKQYSLLVGGIGIMIVKASTYSRDSIKHLINAKDEKERIEKEMLVFYELIYFYLHMLNRQATVYLNEKQIEKMQEYLGELIVMYWFSGNWTFYKRYFVIIN